MSANTRHMGIALYLLVTLLSVTARSHGAEAAEKGIVETARDLASQDDYDKALTILEGGLQKHPKDGEAELMKARIYGWQKRYDLAEKSLNQLLDLEPDNTDILIARGYLYYSQEKLESAARDFAQAQTKQPKDEESKKGAELVKAALDNRAETKSYAWQLDTGFEYSAFARRPQSDWNNEFVQIGRIFNEGRTLAHLAIQRYRQFEITDVQAEIGVDHGFSDTLYGYVYAAITPNPAFRPRWHVATNANLRLFKDATAPNSDFPNVPWSLWTTLDMRFDDYADVTVGGLNPGLRVEAGDGWALGASMISSVQSGTAPVYGWQVKGEGRLFANHGFNIGYADAPETVAGSTVTTQTVFAGIAAAINSACTVRLGYAHDDRAKSYIRHAVNASISHRY
ncbi:MAG: YaiO family outer membrane beta-barrel protein [Bdellovibrionales bacterium]